MDPTCVADLLEGVKDRGNGDKQGLAVVTLYSVGHCREVREGFCKDEAAVAALAMMVGDITKAAHSVRWETLALIGELCRREHQVTTEAATEANAHAETLCTSMASQPSLEQTLTDCMNENTSASPIASDLLSALPFPTVTGWKTKAKDLCYLDPRLDAPWYDIGWGK